MGSCPASPCPVESTANRSAQQAIVPGSVSSAIADVTPFHHAARPSLRIHEATRPSAEPCSNVGLFANPDLLIGGQSRLCGPAARSLEAGGCSRHRPGTAGVLDRDGSIRRSGILCVAWTTADADADPWAASRGVSLRNAQPVTGSVNRAPHVERSSASLDMKNAIVRCTPTSGRHHCPATDLPPASCALGDLRHHHRGGTGRDRRALLPSRGSEGLGFTNGRSTGWPGVPRRPVRCESGRLVAMLALDEDTLTVHYAPVAGASGGFVHDRRDRARYRIAEVPPPGFCRDEIAARHTAGVTDGLRCGTMDVTRVSQSRGGR